MTTVAATTHDVHPGDLEGLLARLRRCDGREFDCTIVVWEACQAVAAEVDRLRAENANLALQQAASVALEVSTGRMLERALAEVERLRAALAAEREACAREAEALVTEHVPLYASGPGYFRLETVEVTRPRTTQEVAAAIRARGTVT